MIPAIVLAGGLGTRIRTHAGGLPKSMISVGGRPFVEYVLDRLADANVPAIHLAVSYRSEVIQTHLGDSYGDIPLFYSVEDTPLGTGGAILKCFRDHRLPRALILNGDTLFHVDLDALVATHLNAASHVTLALRREADTSRYGAVTCDSSHRVIAFEEKRTGGPGLINGGIYVAERSGFDVTNVSSTFSFEHDFLEKNLDALRPLAVISDGYFIDIGIPEDLERARREIAHVT